MKARDLLFSRAAIGVGIAASQVPVGVWYVRRLHDGLDETLGLIPAILALASVPRSLWRSHMGRAEGWGAVAWVAALGVAGPHVRPLIAGTCVAAAFAWLTRAAPGTWGRCLLGFAALPSGPSLQFYLGFPLRRLTTECAAWVLNSFGAGVEALGTLLSGPAGEVAVDSPCDGTHSLWVALVAVAAVATFSRANLRQTFVWGLLALVGVLAANSLRAALLYPFLTGAWPEFRGYHGGVGLVCFVVWFWPWVRAVRARAEENA